MWQRQGDVTTGTESQFVVSAINFQAVWNHREWMTENYDVKIPR